MKKFTAVVIMLVMILIVSACGGNKSLVTKENGSASPSASTNVQESKQAKPSDEKKGNIKIGFIGALSGGSATMGIPAKNAMDLVVQEVNQTGGINGRMIELIAMDDKADPATSATQAQKLVSEDKVVAVIGGPNSATVKANSQVLAEFKVPELISIAQEDTLLDPTAPTYATTFAVSENTTYDVRAVAQYIKSKGYKKAGLIADTSAYGQGGIATTKKVFGEEKIEIAQIVDYAVGAKDLTAQTLKLRDAKVDVVFVLSLGGDAAVFMKAKKQVGWDVEAVGGRGFNMRSFLDLSGEAGEGVILPSIIDPSKPITQDYIKKYDAKYNDDPAYVFSGLGYDSMRLLVQALKTSNGEGGEKLVQALESLKDFETITGGPGHKASFSKDKHIASNENYIVFNQVKDNKFNMVNNQVKTGW